MCRPRARATRFVVVLITALCLTPTAALAGAGHSYSPYPNEDFPREVFFGDTHIHSSWSADAGNMGNRRIGPDEVYRFARGETVTAHNGMPVRLRRPLDLLRSSSGRGDRRIEQRPSKMFFKQGLGF